MASDNSIRQIVADVTAQQPVKKRGKTNRTLSLDSENFVKLQTHCREHGAKVSDVVDKLIAAYLANLNNEEEPKTTVKSA